MKIELSRIHFPITALGPGKRIGIWLQGCSIRCRGCISRDTWDRGLGETTVKDVMEFIAPWLKAAQGVTISGGEPFDQPEALYELLSSIRQTSYSDLLVYSGYPFERIIDYVTHMDGLIDALVTDPYDPDKPQKLPLRGSDNQRLYLLTNTGKEKFSAYTSSDHYQASLNVMFDDDGIVWIAGIPRQGDIQRLLEILKHEGHEGMSSQA